MHYDTSSGQAFWELAWPSHRGRGPPRSRAIALPESPIAFRPSRHARVRAGITAPVLEPMVGAAEAATRFNEW